MIGRKIPIIHTSSVVSSFTVDVSLKTFIEVSDSFDDTGREVRTRNRTSQKE